MISNILAKDAPSGFNRGIDRVIIVIMTDISAQNNIVVNSGTQINNIITMQSDGYFPEAGSGVYYKQHFATQSISSNLFTIGNSGQLELQGFHFNSVIPTSSTIRLFTISSSGGNQVAILTLVDCEFSSLGVSVSHAIILIGTGNLIIIRTQVQSYTFNQKRFIETSIGTPISSVTIINSSFSSIFSQGSGAVLSLQSSSGHIDISGTSFADITGSYGGALNLQLTSTIINLTNQCDFQRCSASQSSSSQGGGAVYASLSLHCLLSIQDATFISCACQQPGNGGALSVLYQSSDQIFITRSTFKSCSTTINSGQGFGWGGAVALQTSSSFETSNFLMTDLIFTDCEAVGQFGPNIHIVCESIKDAGIAIVLNYLITVNDDSDPDNIVPISDLYTSAAYKPLYMGIDSEQAQGGGAQTNHKSLFEIFQDSGSRKEYYIRNTSSNDVGNCPQTSPCITIAHILGLATPPDEDYGEFNLYIILLSNTLSQGEATIDQSTVINTMITIQAQDFEQGESVYTKSCIQTYTQMNRLFSVKNLGVLFLRGLQFNNLISSSSNPLISVLSEDYTIPSLQISECLFIQDSTSTPIPDLNHPIMSINGGTVSILRTSIMNYKFNSQNSFILIRSPYDDKNQIFIARSTFDNIQLTGSGNGAVINSEIKDADYFEIKDQSMFSNCQSGQNGQIYAIISGGEMKLAKISMVSCNAMNGGAIYAQISGGGKVSIADSCQFTSCSASQLGGAIYLNLASGTETQYDLTGASYLTGNNAQFGKSLFINAVNLRSAVPIGDASRIKIGAGNNENSQLTNLMGYHNGNTSIAIPLYYMYTAVDQSIYHVNINSGTNTGNNNVGCGHYYWPCLTIEYALLQNPSSTQRIIGVINEYEFNEIFTISSATYTILIQNSLNPTNNSTTTILSNMKIANNGIFIVNGASIQFNLINFLILSGGLSTDYIIQSISGTSSISILNCEIHQHTTPISRRLVQVTLGSVSITDSKMESFTKSGGSIIKQDGGTLLFTRGQITSVTIESGNMIQISSGTTTLSQFSANGITLSGGSLISYSSSSGNLNIDGCTFTNIQNTMINGNGGVISGTLTSTSGSILITGSASTFTSCTVPNDSGLGGAIYLDIQTDGELKYDLTGASYLTGNNAQFGMNLFINAVNLRSAVPVGDPTRIKIGAGNNEYSQLTNLMGYHNGNTSVAIPLYYMYTAVDQSIYHVKNIDDNNKGNDNIGCGHLDYPCLKIDYAISQSGSATTKIVGIISEYQLNSVVNINLNGAQIQRQIYAVTWSSTSDNSIIQVQPQGQLSISSGSILFNEITFKVESEDWLNQVLDLQHQLIQK
ncbi:MAG: hypothetical protein EZS28_010311 [Streblomastix strix]|uniref:Uncharacterized protein n=1 Tax=Streblomastix strix TaxID=222440 RepID=A0A5J4WIM4_9EUKA|nr:MAG: hypothetical protein EZS28_010311 [Streblomastix strix]